MPAGLSSSTLNLKFMQRAAARTPISAPSTPAPTSSTPSKPDVTPVSSTPQGNSAETPTIASEEPYRWKLDRPVRSAQSDLLIPKQTGPTFETSYMPFMDQESSNEAGPSRSRNGGGGRMMFGYVEPEQEDVDEDMDGEEQVPNGREDDDVVINVRESGKETKKHGRSQPSTMQRGFLRPRSRSPSPSRKDRMVLDKPQSSKPSMKPSTSRQAAGESVSRGKAKEIGSQLGVKQENAGRSSDLSDKPRSRDIPIKHESPLTSKSLDSKNRRKRKQSQVVVSTGTPETSTTNAQDEKKPRLEPSLLNDYPSQSFRPDSTGQSTPVTANSTVNSSASSAAKTNGTLDDRENALKAQRQKEKRARKKAKKAAAKAD